MQEIKQKNEIQTCVIMRRIIANTPLDRHQHHISALIKIEIPLSAYNKQISENKTEQIFQQTFIIDKMLETKQSD